MLEKLVPGDRVMKIPSALDEYEPIIPYGSSGVVQDHEGIHNSRNVHTFELSEAYGCLVIFDNYPAPNAGRGWFMRRERLMKISPDEELIHDEEIAKISNLNEEIQQVKQGLIKAKEKNSKIS